MSLITDAIAAALLRSAHALSNGVKIPQLFEPVSKTWVPPTGTPEGAMNVTLTGSSGQQVSVTNNKLDVNATVNATVSGTGEEIISAPVVGVKTVVATAAELFAGASAKAGRRKLVIKNEDQCLRLRVGPSTLTQQNGYPIEPGAIAEFKFDPNTAVPIYAISEGAAISVVVWEV